MYFQNFYNFMENYTYAYVKCIYLFVNYKKSYDCHCFDNACYFYKLCSIQIIDANAAF